MRNQNTDPSIKRRGQAITAIRCLQKLAENRDTRAQAALEAWNTVPRNKPGTVKKRASKRNL